MGSLIFFQYDKLKYKHYVSACAFSVTLKGFDFTENSYCVTE